MSKFEENPTAVVLGLLIGTLVIMPWLLVLSWNHVMPYLFELKQINYSHALALMIIPSCLFNRNTSRDRKREE